MSKYFNDAISFEENLGLIGLAISDVLADAKISWVDRVRLAQALRQSYIEFTILRKQRDLSLMESAVCGKNNGEKP